MSLNEETRKKIRTLAQLSYDMGFDEEQSIVLMLHSRNDGSMDNLIEWLKKNPKATIEDAFEFLSE